jgi:hypothetical protein
LEPTSRFKPISQFVDSHEKLFRELREPELPNAKPTDLAVEVTCDLFDSQFESGNLGIVYKREESRTRQYFLLLENDVNTHGYASWFFFKVRSCGKGKACFHILNLSKPPILYKVGWRVSIFSVGRLAEEGRRWFKGGTNLQIYETNFEKGSNDGGTYKCLYFEYDFEEYETDVYFAMSKPYTYTMLIESLDKLSKTLEGSPTTKCTIIKSIYSISCNIIPILVL